MFQPGSRVCVASDYVDPALVGLKGFVRELYPDRSCPYTVYIYALDLELRFKDDQLEPLQDPVLFPGDELNDKVIGA